ncbi:MAG: hypothetical protein DI536_37050 [Archangium gephyra]|uniref:Kinesin motor domain-containing protein n=1 Tax=Archangium gephyra TaxID=48 RepID=A0A2W5UGM8_9BACT|nr:MAG: hypothetical protein DI536_37050 [Archangium gephyra]
MLAALASRAPHVPYRNSKLTHLLSGVLAAASSKTVMLVACAPEPDSASETLCTLRFAAKVNATELGAARPVIEGSRTGKLSRKS